MAEAYEVKRDGLARGSGEELFSLRLISRAFADGLRLAGTDWIFVAHELACAPVERIERKDRSAGIRSFETSARGDRAEGVEE